MGQRQSDIDRIVELEAENKRLRQRLLTAAGDDLCRLTQEEIEEMTGGRMQIPPKEEFLASCERFHSQMAAEGGVNHSCLTLAQLVAEHEKLRQEIVHLKGRVEYWKEQYLGKDVWKPGITPCRIFDATGREYLEVLECNLVEGWIVCAMRDEKGMLVIRGDEIVRVEYRDVPKPIRIESLVGAKDAHRK